MYGEREYENKFGIVLRFFFVADKNTFSSFLLYMTQQKAHRTRHSDRFYSLISLEVCKMASGVWWVSHQTALKCSGQQRVGLFYNAAKSIKAQCHCLATQYCSETPASFCLHSINMSFAV